MNIAITNVSKLTLNKDTKGLVHRNYIDEDENLIDGVMTNEAPLKSLIRRLAVRGEKLDRIIFIESNTVREKINIPEYGEYTHADFLRLRINENLKGAQVLYDNEKDSIRIEDEPDESAVSKTIFTVYERMTELYKESQQNENNKNLNVYIEANGGVRYVLTMLLSIMRTLENSLDNFHIKEIISMVLNKTPVKIFNTKAVYDCKRQALFYIVR